MTGPDLLVRPVRAADIPALCALKPGDALHRDRIRDAEAPGFQYLVLVEGEEVIGFACLVFVKPSSWSDATDQSHLPQVIDLQIAESQRGRGHGSYLIREMERLTAEAGSRDLTITVNYPANARAHALYVRLGYRADSADPYLIHWEFTDSAGILHQGDDRRLAMVKVL